MGGCAACAAHSHPSAAGATRDVDASTVTHRSSLTLGRGRVHGVARAWARVALADESKRATSVRYCARDCLA
jgi:hypothetical protein